jgi:hypothetical protein
MGQYASLTQPRPSPAMDTLRALVPEGTDVIRVRAATRTAATNWAWTQAELTGAYHWPEYPGEPLVSLDGPYPDDSLHTSLTIREFLHRYAQAGNVHLVRGNDVAYVYQIDLARPRWDDWEH